MHFDERQNGLLTKENNGGCNRDADHAPSLVTTFDSKTEDILNVVVPRFHGFVYQRDDGALIGPFNAMLHFSMFGAWAWAFKALREHSELPKPVVQLVILVTGARFGARYEIYAHEIMAEDAGLCAPRSPRS